MDFLLFSMMIIGNKRTAEQSCDQTLTRMNKALAVNCNAKLDPVNGATAEDWRGGIPVRVVRNFKLGKHSKYAPKEGNRYVRYQILSPYLYFKIYQFTNIKCTNHLYEC